MAGFPTTVEEFLSPDSPVRNIYLKGEKDFLQLYVRKGPKGIWLAERGLVMFDNVFQIAWVEARHPKAGALRRLIERVDRLSDAQLPIYVENVFNEEAVEGLSKSSMSFMRVDVDISPAPCFLLMRPLTNPEAIL